MVLSEPGSSLGHAEAGSSRQQEEAKASQQQEQPKTAKAVGSEDDDVLEEIQGYPQDGHQHIYVCHQCGDHYICHEEIPIDDETRKVELAAKRLIAEV
jgi:uncharacterized protein YbaR (Trm112 family)